MPRAKKPKSNNKTIEALLKKGWRYESLGGELPVVTNAPKGKILCVVCGQWGPPAQYSLCMCWECGRVGA
jgi:hypothetical protein